MLAEWIDLDREFLELELVPAHPPTNDLSSITPDEDTSQQRLLDRAATPQKWPELLAGHVTVVLGNAGSGKTREFQEQTKKLNAKGVTAFFARLDYLVRQDSAAVFGDPTRFNRWRDS